MGRILSSVGGRIHLDTLVPTRIRIHRLQPSPCLLHWRTHHCVSMSAGIFVEYCLESPGPTSWSYLETEENFYDVV